MDTTRHSLLIRVKDREDSIAWREFDAIYRPILNRYAKQFGLSDADAEDITQQCMTSLIDYVGKFEYDPQKGRFKGLLRRIAKNNVLKRVRKKQEQIADSQHFKQPQQREDSPEEVFEKVWLEQHLAHCLKLIRPKVHETTYRAFVMNVLEERPTDEICKELGVTASQIHKAKWRITQMIDENLTRILGDVEL